MPQRTHKLAGTKAVRFDDPVTLGTSPRVLVEGADMPWWPFARMAHNTMRPTNSPTFALEQRASAAFFAKRWTEAERLFLEVLAKADSEGRQVARNMLGEVYEHQGRIDDALAMYEANLTERCPFMSYVKRLAIIYRRLGRPDDELRVLLFGSQSARNAKFGRWCKDRLQKLT